MTDFIDDDVDADDEEAAEKSRFEELLPLAIDTARTAKFNPEVRDDEWAGKSLLIRLPSGRDTRDVEFDSASELRSFIDLEHEGIVFIDGLEALADFKNGIVEVAIQTVGSGSPGSAANLFQRHASGNIDPSIIVNLEDTVAGHSCELGPPTSRFKLLSWRFRHRGVTLKVQIGNVRGNEHIKSLLVKLTNSLFFQVDLLTNHPLGMVKARTATTKGRAFRRTSLGISNLQFPKHEYEEAPCSLYWYGRSAGAMPLLQFLAFYQVVEFFYPVHSKSEINRRLRMVLNDPSFRADRDFDLAKVIQTMTLNRSGGFMDERSQLKATIIECATSESIRQFFCPRPRKRRAFTKTIIKSCLKSKFR